MKKCLLFVGVFLILCQVLNAVEYNGKNVDGETYDASAYSYDTGEDYDVEVEFKGDAARLHFQNGSELTIFIDDDIDDPHNITGSDERGVNWDIDVDGMDD
jgi:hypothetical protein